MKLGVGTVCPHIFHEGRWWSYEPYVLEMNVWNDLFGELIVVAPMDQGPPPDFWAPYQRSATVSVVPYRRDKGRGLAQLPTSACEIPRMIYALASAARRTDAFHLRGPGSIALCGSLLLPLLQRRLIAKFAGQWMGYPGEPRSVRWQRAILRSRWWRGLVTVYGQWPDQPPHVIPFFTSVLNPQQGARAKAAARARTRTDFTSRPLRLLYVGRLSSAKHVEAIIEAVARLKDELVSVECDVVGDGPERAALERRAAILQVQPQVRFTGGISFEQVLAFYERADALVLISDTEGWPKAIAEAMSFGLVCVGSDRGLIPWMLAAGAAEPRGLVVPPGDAEGLAASVCELVRQPEMFFEMGQRAAAWSEGYSLESLREALRTLLTERWQVELGS